MHGTMSLKLICYGFIFYEKWSCKQNYESVTIYYVSNTTYINQQLLKVKILATCFSYSESSSGQLHCTAHNTHAALRHAATSPNTYNDVILPSVLT